jgi:hypothetical protein
MRVPYGEGVASHTGPESCGCVRKDVVEALTGVRAGRVLSPVILTVRDADALMSRGRPNRSTRHREGLTGPAGSQTPSTHASTSQGRRSLPSGSREIPGSAPTRIGVRAVNLKGERRR